MKIKKMSESEKGVFLAAGIIVSIFLVSGVCFLRACGILPYTRRWFTSYNAFCQQADRVVAPYPSVLSAGAEDIKYFYHTGWLDKKTGISFTVSDEDYQKIQEVYLSSYKKKQMITRETIRILRINTCQNMGIIRIRQPMTGCMCLMKS